MKSTRIALVAMLATAVIATAATPGRSAEIVDRASAAPRDEALLRAARRSADLRLRILFAQDTVTTEATTRFVDAIPLDDLLDGARGSIDPLVLQLLLDRCTREPRSSSSRCAAPDEQIALARRWVAVDAQNQVAWIELSTILERSGDRAAADEAWTRASRATTFRDPYYPIARVILAALPVDPDPTVRRQDLVSVIGISAAVATSWLTDAINGCKAEARRSACGDIADTAFRDADTFAALAIGRVLTGRSRRPDTLIQDRRQAEQALLWALARLDRAAEADATGTADRQAATAANNLLVDRIARGEVAVARDVLRAERISDAEGARRYRALLADWVGRPTPR